MPAINKLDYTGVEIKSRNNYTYDNEYVEIPETEDLRVYGAVALVGTNLFSFGNSQVFKCNLQTYTSEYLSTIPFIGYEMNVAVVGTNIFLFGSLDNSQEPRGAYKYDTLLDTFTQLTDMPITIYEGRTVAVGTKIFFFGGNTSTYSFDLVYVYDTTSDNYTRLSDLPERMNSVAPVLHDGKIYLCRDESYEYDIETDTYTQLPSIFSADFIGGGISAGDYILLYPERNMGDEWYAWYPEEGNVKRLRPMPDNKGVNGSFVIGNEVLIIPDDIMPQDTWYMMRKINYISNHVYLFDLYNNSWPAEFPGQYVAKLSDLITTTVYHASVAIDGELKKYPAFYGDGTQWNSLPS